MLTKKGHLVQTGRVEVVGSGVNTRINASILTPDVREPAKPLGLRSHSAWGERPGDVLI